MTHEPPPMSSALRALVDADNQRPGPSDIDRRRVYAAIGASLGALPAGALVAAHFAGATTASSSTLTTAVGAASVVSRVAMVFKAPLVSVGLGVLLGATLTVYAVKGPVARWAAGARARDTAATTVMSPRTASAPQAEPAATSVASPRIATSVASPRAAAAALAEPASAAVTRTDEARPQLGALPEANDTLASPRPLPATVHHASAPASAEGRPASSAKLAAAAAAEAVPALDPAAAGPGTLSTEQTLLDPARASLAQGDGAGALARLALHERRFPNGALAQEREAMTIRALVLAGDRDHARGRAARFRASYPGSVLWPMIVATIDGTTEGKTRAPR